MNETGNFSEIVDQFLEDWCDQGADLSVTQLALFEKFRVFWAQASHRWIDEASFLDFSIEMQRRGYQASRKGKRYWYGLTLRKKPQSQQRRSRRYENREG